MEKSFLIIADRYYKKALSLERENMPSKFEWYNSNPLHMRRGEKISISAGLFLKGSVSSYWLNKPQELYFKNSKKSFLLEAATLFFSEYLKENNPIEKTTSEPQRYGLLAVIYGEFHQICEKLEELNIYPQEGKSLYFAALHRLTEDISN